MIRTLPVDTEDCPITFRLQDDDVEAARVRESDGGAAGAGAQEEEEEGGEDEEGPDGNQDHDQQPQQADGE